MARWAEWEETMNLYSLVVNFKEGSTSGEKYVCMEGYY
jgi:hypothetical protein